MSYIVQGCWSDDRILCEWTCDDNATEQRAIREGEIFLNDPTFEGDYVRVITSDGELVWDSRRKDNAR